jgi:hypothetical protein
VESFCESGNEQSGSIKSGKLSSVLTTGASRVVLSSLKLVGY